MPPRKKSRPSQEPRWTVVEPRIIPDWETAHVFLEVARCGSFRAAADKLSLSVNALRRKVDELEGRMGFPLFLRRITGVQLTGEGAPIYEAALQMEKASFGLLSARDISGKDNEGGEVSVAITEGLGTFWLTTQLADLRRENPNLTVNLTCAMTSPDVLRMEADIAVGFDRPRASDLRIAKLGRVHLMFYAHRSYLEEHGAPASVADLRKHRFVIQSDAKGKWLISEKHFFPGISPAGLLALRCNVSTTNAWSILSGLGIGVLPTYSEVIGTGLVALDLVPAFPVDIWITYHADAKRIARVRKTIEWLTQAFDPRRYPWFRDEFIHPRKFSQHYKGESVQKAAFTPGRK